MGYGSFNGFNGRDVYSETSSTRVTISAQLGPFILAEYDTVH